MTWYCVTISNWSPPSLSEVEVTRASESCVWTRNGRRSNKRSDYTNYFKTFADARAFMENECLRGIERHGEQAVNSKERADEFRKALAALATKEPAQEETE